MAPGIVLRSSVAESRCSADTFPPGQGMPRATNSKWEHRDGFKTEQQDFGPSSKRCRCSWRWRPGSSPRLRRRHRRPRFVRKPQPAPPDTSPLARFVPKENLVVYLEFAGLDAHEAAWKNTSSYKMLTETTLGEMLGAVSEQLLEKVVNYIPGHRLSGSEIVSLIKHSARSGWVVALNADSKAGSGFRGTFVLRGGASKENRLLTSRLMGWVMGSSRPKVQKKEGRNLVVVPAAGAAHASGWRRRLGLVGRTE